MAWANVSDNLKKELYRKRTNNGIVKQPSNGADLLKLNDILDLHKIDAFGNVETVRDQLNSICREYEFGGGWVQANYLAPTTFYRLENIDSFISKHKKLFSTVIDTPTALNLDSSIQTNEEIFESIVISYENKKQWLDLTDLVESFYNYRGFSWWTDDFVHHDDFMPQYFVGSNLSQENKWILEFAFRVGISSDWLSDSLLFLKFEVANDADHLFKVPSIIDAYNQPIFSPQSETPLPKNGLAIELIADPKPNGREFVIQNVPVELVKFIPVKIDLKGVDAINPHARLNDLLVNDLIKQL